MAAFLVRSLNLANSASDSFVDDDDSYFEPEIEALHASGITQGCTTTEFCPDKPITRAEMAAFLIRFLDAK
jgi:hypothetical protein